MTDHTDNPAGQDDQQDAKHFVKASAAVFAAGFATFSALYCVQPLMPSFSDYFGVSPAISSLSLSLTTGVLAFSIFLAGVVSEALDRKRVMGLCLAGSAVLSFVAAMAPSWGVLLTARALSGAVLGGVPALALAYLAEETEASKLGFAAGLYIGGNAIGGMSGRVLSGVMAEMGGWQLSFWVEGVIGIVATIVFWWLLPRSKSFHPRHGLSFGQHLAPILDHIRHAGLRWLFVSAFALMGAFVTVYNYLAYRLTAPPFGLSESAIGAVFIVYLLGTMTSTAAGRLADRYGRPSVMGTGIVIMLIGLALTMGLSLPIIIAGIALVTSGFFAAHGTASGWTGQLADYGKGQAASLYFLAYYLGSSFIGSLGGVFWDYGGWDGVMLLVGCLMALAVVALVRLWRFQSRQAV